MDRNLRATAAYSWTEGSTVRGSHYQWWRNDTGFTTWSSDSWYSWTERAQWPCPSWRHVPSTAEWDWLVKAWFTYRGGSCTATAWNLCSWYWNATLANFKSDLKLPLAGARYPNNASVGHQGTLGYYWSSSPEVASARNLSFYSSNVYPQDYYTRGYGYSVRCFKN